VDVDDLAVLHPPDGALGGLAAAEFEAGHDLVALEFDELDGDRPKQRAKSASVLTTESLAWSRHHLGGANGNPG